MGIFGIGNFLIILIIVILEKVENGIFGNWEFMVVWLKLVKRKKEGSCEGCVFCFLLLVENFLLVICFPFFNIFKRM